MENLHFLRYTHTQTDTHTYGYYIIRIYYHIVDFNINNFSFLSDVKKKRFLKQLNKFYILYEFSVKMENRGK